jgi:hypothetical protein
MNLLRQLDFTHPTFELRRFLWEMTVKNYNQNRGNTSIIYEIHLPNSPFVESFWHGRTEKDNVTNCPADISWCMYFLKGLTEEDYARLAFGEKFMTEQGGFNKLQSYQPQTIAYALTDSPVGQLAWSGQLFGDAVSDDYALTNVMIYWLTGTAGSSARIYYEDTHSQNQAGEPTTFPLGVAIFAQDFKSIRHFAERDHKNIVHWSEYERGSHHASQDAPDLLIEDLRKFFRRLRSKN